MAKWTLPEGKIYTQADLDAAVAAALREAVRLSNNVDPHDKPAWANAGTWAHCAEVYAMRIAALIPDAGAALDRALAAERERLLNAADTLGYECEGCGHICGNPDTDLAILRKAGARACCPERKMRPLSAAIRAQGDKT